MEDLYSPEETENLSETDSISDETAYSAIQFFLEHTQCSYCDTYVKARNRQEATRLCECKPYRYKSVRTVYTKRVS